MTEEPPIAHETEAPKVPSIQEELKECKDKYLRLLAEKENVVKRMQKEKQELTRFAVENVIADILMPMDNLENALGFADNMSDEVRNWAQGFQMILSQFKDVLNQHGVAVFSSIGEHFDPHRHEAVEMEETADFPSGTVIEEFVRGYKCGDRIVRPARVKVAKAPANKELENN